MILPPATRQSGRLLYRWGGGGVLGFILLMLRIGLRAKSAGESRSGYAGTTSTGNAGSAMNAPAARLWHERAEEAMDIVVGPPGRADDIGKQLVATMFPGGTLKQAMGQVKHDGLRVQLIFSATWLPAEGGDRPEEIRVIWVVEQAGPGKLELIQSSAKTPPQTGWQPRVAAWLASEIWPAVRKRAELPE